MIRKHDDDYNIDKICFYVKDPNGSKYQYLIKKLLKNGKKKPTRRNKDDVYSYGENH